MLIRTIPTTCPADARRSRRLRRSGLLVAFALLLCVAQAIVATEAHALTDAQEEDSPAQIDAEYWNTALPWHPKLVHVPIALCMLMPGITIGLLLLVRLGWMDRRAFLIAAGLQLALAVSSLAALQTGHDDAAEVEGYASDRALDTHDTRAHQFVYVAVGTALLFTLLLLSERKRSLQPVALAAVVVAVMAQGYAGYRVGDAGGRLVYVGNAADAHK